MDVIGDTLTTEAEKRKKGIDKAKEFVERIQWFRLIKLVAGSAVALTRGTAAGGIDRRAVWRSERRFSVETATPRPWKRLKKPSARRTDAATGLLGLQKEFSPPQEIHALRESFEKTLEAMGVTLVVLIDDLDRCLPETTISTLEAIRLVPVPEEHRIRDRRRRRDDQARRPAAFPGRGRNDDLVINYFDKLIQLPIRVPPLGTQEVRAYMMLLYVENSESRRQGKGRNPGGHLQTARADMAREARGPRFHAISAR